MIRVVGLAALGLAAAGLIAVGAFRAEKASRTPALPADVEALLLAAESGRTDEVRAALDAGVPIDSADRLSRTALTAAIERGQPGAVALLMQRGADVNKPGARGETPLFVAANNGDLALVERLLAAGAEVRAVNEEGVTALHAAARSPGEATVDVIERLLSAGAAIDAQDNEGFTGLMVAASRGRVAPVQSLIKAGAGVNARNNLGMTALMYAVVSGDFSTRVDWQYLGDLRRVTAAELGAIAVALDDTNALACVQALLAAGADVNARDNEGWTPIMRAALIGDTARFRRTVAQTQASADDPKMEATYDRLREVARSVDITRTLRNADAVVNYVAKPGFSALDIARARQDSDGHLIMAFLLEGRQVSGPGTNMPSPDEAPDETPPGGEGGATPPG